MSRNLKCLGCVLNESGTDEGECSRKVASGRKVASDVRSLQLECDWVLHVSLLVPVLTYGSETVIWTKEERSRIKAVQPQRSAAYKENG